MRQTLNIFLIILLLNSILIARGFRVDQIPNGAKFDCANCHINPSGGGGPTAFGEDVFDFLDVQSSEGNVQWGSLLASMDSDGDGVTNGEELLDPDGAWSIGQADPGSAENVTNPGDENSVSAIPAHGPQPKEFSLKQNYPNPFNPSTRIEFTLQKSEYVELLVYNVLGKEVAKLVSVNLSQGNHIYTFNANDLAGGIYYYKLTAGEYLDVKKMILLR